MDYRRLSRNSLDFIIRDVRKFSRIEKQIIINSEILYVSLLLNRLIVDNSLNCIKFHFRYYNNAYDYILRIIFSFIAKVLNGSTSTFKFSLISDSRWCKTANIASTDETRRQIPDVTDRTESKCWRLPFALAKSVHICIRVCTLYACVCVCEKSIWESAEGCRYAQRSKCEGWVGGQSSAYATAWSS